jgi:serine/threonine transporter
MKNNIFVQYTRTNLIFRILGGIIIGLVLGLIIPKAEFITIFGTIFIGALKAIAPILVFILVISAISKASSGIGPKFRNVVFLYLITTIIASVFAVIVSRVFPLTVPLSAASDIEATTPQSFSDIFNGLINNLVENPISAMANGNYLGILFWSILVGLALKMVEDKVTNDVMEKLSKAISMIVGWIIQLAPVGIMGIVFESVSKNGISIFTDYGKLILELALCIIFVGLVTNPLVMFICTKKNPYPIVFKCLKESAFSAFFTRSSAANIPINMRLCEKLGLDKDFYSVSIPLGATINMDGAAIVITIMSLTLANTMRIYVPLPMALVLAIVSTLAACGSSGVAGGSLLLIPMACSFLGIPNDVAMQMVGVGFVISFIQDSMETALNSSSDVEFTACAEYMAKKRAKGRVVRMNNNQTGSR